MCRYAIVLVILMTFWSCSNAESPPVESATEASQPVKTGAEVLLENFLPDLEGRSVGLVMNPTARVHGTHVLDTLLTLGVSIKALYAPEHGFRGDYGAGERISDGVDEQSGLPVFSLYGQTRKPTPEMLEGIDLLIFDMQDVGARFYTYLSTMGLVMEAAAEQEIELWILDRPNPAGGDYVSGWLLEPEHTSFVGAYPIPIAHGMTLGELANMIVGESWMLTNRTLDYRILPVQGWSRNMQWHETGLEWVPPSPNLPTFEHAFVYLGTCMIEGTTMSEGRGTTDSFLLVGDPSLTVDTVILSDLMQKYPVLLGDSTFSPVEIPGRASRPKHEGAQVQGISIQMNFDEIESFDPVAFGHELMRTMLRNAPAASTNNFLFRLAGTDRISEYVHGDSDAAEMWEDEVEAFRERRAPYLIYE